MFKHIAHARVEPVTAGDDFWARYHVFRRRRQQDSRPEDPVQPDAEEEAVLKRRDPFHVYDRFEVSRDGRMLSFFDGLVVSPESPEYETSRHLYETDIYVVPDHRREGIGSSWLPLVAELMERHGCTTVGFWVEQEPGHAFMRWLGAEARLSSIESRLDFTQIDWAMLERWVADGRRRSPDTRLEFYEGRVPEAMWPEFAPQLSSLLNTIPFEGLDHGEIVITPERMRDHYERMKLTGVLVYTVVAREPDGVISGITDLSWAPFRPRNIHQMFTGVRPDARGRGLGKWIKAAMLLRIRELYPGTRWIITDNAGSNAPMLKINRAIGFKSYRSGIAYQMTHDALAARLREI